MLLPRLLATALLVPGLVTAVLGGATTGEARAERTEAPVLCGRVVDELGRPMAGARVLARGDARPRRDEGSDTGDDVEAGDLVPLDAPRFGAGDVVTGRTDEDGRFALAGLPPGPVRVALRAPGHAGRDVEGLRLAAHGRTDAGTFELAFARTISGTVVDAFGSAVEGAEVAALDPARASSNDGLAVARPLATTDAGGGFRTDELDEGTWTLVVRAAGQPEARFERVVPHGDDDRHVELRLAHGATIAGMVVVDGALDGTPNGVPLVVHALPLAVTDAHLFDGRRRRSPGELLGYRTAGLADDGSFELVGLRAETAYTLQALPRDVWAGTGDAWSAPVLARAGERLVRLVGTAGARLTLRAVDARTGEPVERFAARLKHGQAWGTGGDTLVQRELGPPWPVHPGGRLQLDGIRPPNSDAHASLFVHAPGYEPLEQRVSIAPGLASELGEVRLVPRPTLDVLVTDEDGEPLANAEVSVVPLSEDVWDSPRIALTRPDGVARVEDLPNFVRALGVRRAGFAPCVLKSPFPVEGAGEDEAEGDAEPRPLHVALERGSFVRVRVTGSTGLALPAAPVVREIDDDDLALFGWTRETRLTGADGVALFPGLVRGVHAFVAARGETPEPFEWTAARVDGETDVEVALGSPELASLRGVVLEAGVPLVGASVRWTLDGAEEQDERPPDRVTRTGERGAFELLGLAPGPCVIEVEHPARASTWPTREELDPGVQERRLDLPPVVLMGTVLDVQGRPVVGAEVRLAGAARDVFDPDAGSPPLARSDFAGGFALRGVDPETRLELVVRDPATGAVARLAVGAFDPAETGGLVDLPRLELAPPASLKVPPLPPELAAELAETLPLQPGGMYALVASHRASADTSWDARPKGHRSRHRWQRREGPVTKSAFVAQRALVPYALGEATIEGLERGGWDLTVVALDGFGRVSGSWELARLELGPGEARTLRLE